MKIAVIGLGSMGKRRIRLIKKYSPDFEITGIDTNAERRVNAGELYDIDLSDNLEKALNEQTFDAAFVCTSPLSHAKIISTILKHSVSVFSEINLIADGYDDNIATSLENNCLLFLSSTFLYRDEVKFIKGEVKKSVKPLNYIYHIGQYLPDWHPWESYKNFFVGDRRTNGCREIFAIELPWIIDTFGEIESVSVQKSKNTTLDIDYNDNYIVTIKHKNSNKGVLCVDVISRKAVRNFEVLGEDLYISWDGSPSGLYKYDTEKKENTAIELYTQIDKQEGYAANIIENAYYNEVATFFDCLADRSKNAYGFADDKSTLSVIDKIEE